jgi:hypothetical protein
LISSLKNFVTLDLDGISYREALKLFHEFLEKEKPLNAALYFSATRGFHVEATFKQMRDNWALRDYWKDDGRRLVHEILGERMEIGETLWDCKIELKEIGGKLQINPMSRTLIESFADPCRNVRNKDNSE